MQPPIHRRRRLRSRQPARIDAPRATRPRARHPSEVHRLEHVFARDCPTRVVPDAIMSPDKQQRQTPSSDVRRILGLKDELSWFR